MKAYIVRSEDRIEPFGEYPRDCLITNEKLSCLQEIALRKVAEELIFLDDFHEISTKEEYILLSDDLYFSPELLEEFVLRSRKLKNAKTICALKRGITTLRTGADGQSLDSNIVFYDLHYFPGEKEENPSDETIVIDPDEFSVSVPMPNHMCSNENYIVPMTDKFIIRIDNWAKLWAANIVTILSDGARLKRSSKMKLALLALKARSFNKWKILCGLNKIGKNCDIHPTALIEGSSIGDNSVIGAGAIIRESIIGDNVSIGNGVVVEESVIGEKSVILNGHILYSVLYPGSFSVSEMVSASFLGRDSFIGLGAVLADFRLDGKNTAVMKDGELVDSGNKFLGSCLGHGSYLGSGCVVAPGRIIPSGMRIALDKEKTVCDSSNLENSANFRVVKN